MEFNLDYMDESDMKILLEYIKEIKANHILYNNECLLCVNEEEKKYLFYSNEYGMRDALTFLITNNNIYDILNCENIYYYVMREINLSIHIMEKKGFKNICIE